jgi:transposase-like protein
LESLSFTYNSANLSFETKKKLASKKTQKGVYKELSTIKVFHEIYPDSEAVFKRIFEVRSMKADGKCPNCGAHINSFFKRMGTKYKYRCKNCRKIFSPLSGTPFHKLRVPLRVLMDYLYRILCRQGVSINQLSSDFGQKYDTAWKTAQRIMEWMGFVVDEQTFENEVTQVDEVYTKKRGGIPKDFKISQGMRKSSTQPVFVMATPDGGAKAVRINNADSSTVSQHIFDYVSTTSPIHSDESKIYLWLDSKDNNYTHYTCNHGEKEWSKNGVHVNHAESFNACIKKRLDKIHKTVSYDHMQKYLDAASLVFSNRNVHLLQTVDELFESLPTLGDNSYQIKLGKKTK